MVRGLNARTARIFGSPHPRGDGPSIVNGWTGVFQFSPPAWGWSERLRSEAMDDYVLPTRVGMVRGRKQPPATRISSPHPRGDGPQNHTHTGATRVFSPPAWGWSDAWATMLSGLLVLPTRVGMVREMGRALPNGGGSPHPRGDGPRRGYYLPDSEEFSPPAWGWSDGGDGCRFAGRVLPTRVGMVRRQAPGFVYGGRSPHPRGDGPKREQHAAFRERFSPPAWGWSAEGELATERARVLPTRVGMVRLREPAAAWLNCSPHPRGDGPEVKRSKEREARFSPPAWGWSEASGYGICAKVVLPTRVGMVRAKKPFPFRQGSSPHPRGDGPLEWIRQWFAELFSPPAWGWSGDDALPRHAQAVLPTRVGMVRPRIGCGARRSGSPHPRGDGPKTATNPQTVVSFSPPAWGWSGFEQTGCADECVLPTRVGMVRGCLIPRPKTPGSPHPRGDGPPGITGPSALY